MQTTDGSLVSRISDAPSLGDGPVVVAVFDDLMARVGSDEGTVRLQELTRRTEVEALLSGTVKGSPYLANLIRADLARLERLLDANPDTHLSELIAALYRNMQSAADDASAMAILRQTKNEAALLIALCDLGGVWQVMTVTDALTQVADATLQSAIDYLFRRAAAQGKWQPASEDCPAAGSGYFILAMGKHGAHELNYSSDIDLIVFFDKSVAKACLEDTLEMPSFFIRLTQRLLKLMSERTEHGYVFRTDLRLRPDAGATQVALSTEAAHAYYESFGQNWERAAFIKARAVAGDVQAGERFLEELQPFIWRKYLDFAAISDIHAMKRQIHAFRGFGKVAVQGHNIKVGRGGIREIEFFAQTQQLIAGGRQPGLRSRKTLETLRTLADTGWIAAEVRDDLDAAYRFLRTIEHRLQMVTDEQTQELPSDDDRFRSLALFSGFGTAEAFVEKLRNTLQTVQGHYVNLFEDAPELTSGQKNMVFTGQDDDPETVAILSRMGFAKPSAVLGVVRSWHSGRYAAVRSARSREILTEVQPILIEALSKTADPDGALLSFDRFLLELPTGVQLFSLLHANPNLLRLVADIMGTAPRLAGILSRRRRLLDAVIDPRMFQDLPDEQELDEHINAEIARGTTFEERLERARIVGSEQSFLIGVRVLSGTVTASQAGSAYALLAERLVDELLDCARQELEQAHGSISGGQVVVIAMGKLGGREMTATSDLDLILVYDHDDDASASDGPRPLAPSQYYARLTQRLISALSAPTAEGVLYEVDMRLRPSGQQGPVATRLSSFVRYQAEEAWTWEHMALTRARPIVGPDALCRKVEVAIDAALQKRRDRAKIAADVREMRERIFAEKGTQDIWDLKNVRGGLVDLEFIAQFLQLLHAREHPEVLSQNTGEALQRLRERDLLSSADADVLLPAISLFHNVGQVLRICVAKSFDPKVASEGLKLLAARGGGVPDFESLESVLRETASNVAARFERIISG